MPTDPPPLALIDRLAGELRPVRRRRTWIEVLVLGGLFGIELAMLVAEGHMRSDMPHAMGMPSFWWKLSGLAAIVAVGSATALLSLDPTRSPRRGLRALAIVLLAVLAGGWAVDAVQTAWHGGGAGLRARLDPVDGLHCALSIAALALPAAIALGVWMRRGASVDPAGSAWAAGIAASAWGGLAFAFACPFDDPLYLAVWYGLAGLVITLVSRWLLPRIARW